MAIKHMTFFLLLLISIVASRKTSTSKSHVIKTIRVSAKHGGDIVDCVDINKQPAFSHPALKNHTIQMKASHLPPTTDQKRTMNNSYSSTSQAWLKYGSCPNETVPIRRSKNNYQTNGGQSNVIFTPEHSFTVVLTEGFSYSGAKANIKVWNPYVEPEGTEYSSSQVMLRNGPKSFSAAQAGWAVNPSIYGDGETRLSAYWTNDGMQNTRCFDVMCPGFVQTSREVLLGGYIGDLYASEIVIQISKDPFTHNWVLLYNDKQVGYWPGDIFTNMKYQANLVQWGGVVQSPKVGRNHPHTATEMGSGRYADYVFGRSGVMKGMLIEENSHELKTPETLFVSSDEWDCYDGKLVQERGREPVFFYGGPGSRNNPRCS